MLLTQRRPLIIVALAALCAAMFAFSATSASAEEEESAQVHPILERAFQDLGTYQGQCWTWMRQVVEEATGRTVGFDYRLGFFEAGAIEVAPEDAAPGDIIQIADDSYTAPDADYLGLHTAIVVANNGDGTFDVIDSNSQWDGVVRFRESYDPGASAARYAGLTYRVYRIGEYEGAIAPPAPLPKLLPPPAEPLHKGDYATVNAPSECLNLRSGAGVSFGIVKCMTHGTRVKLISDVTAIGGLQWVQVSTPHGNGWVAANYLVKASAPSEGSGVGAVKPATPFRLFIGGIGADR